MSVVAKALGDALDRLNNEIREVEHFFEDLGIGEPAEVPLCEGHLGFGKTEGEWRFMYTSSDVTTPLRNAPKRIRIEACKVIPQLLVAVRESGVTRLTEVNEAIAALKEIRGAT